MYRNFRTNPNYLSQYHFSIFGLLVVANVALYYLLGTSPTEFLLMSVAIYLVASIDIYSVMAGAVFAIGASLYLNGFQVTSLLGLPVAAASALFLTGILHNASHDNFKPRWLRRPIGELAALVQLAGFADWVIVHVIHHSHPDDPVKDPHPPLDMSYWKYLIGMRQAILTVIATEYFEKFGRNEKSMKALSRLGLAARLAQLSRVLFFWQIFGSRWFAFFFAPSIVIKMLHYAWLNYITHDPTPEGEPIRDLDSGIYKVANFLSCGIYCHSSHHKNPKIFNPSSVGLFASKSPISTIRKNAA